MKSIKFLILFVFTVIITSPSCKKDSVEKNYCATCVEATSGYQPADFCGPESKVDAYISELKKQGNTVGLSFNCTKKLSSK